MSGRAPFGSIPSGLLPVSGLIPKAFRNIFSVSEACLSASVGALSLLSPYNSLLGSWAAVGLACELPIVAGTVLDNVDDRQACSGKATSWHRGLYTLTNDSDEGTKLLQWIARQSI